MKNLALWRAHISEMCEMFYRFNRPYPKSVLDIGFGDSSVLVKTLYPHAKLMDYAPPPQDFIKRLFPNGEVVGLDYNLDISQVFLQEECNKYYGKFDTIFAVDLLEHVKKPWITATNLFNMLKEDGYLFLSAPSIGIEHHPHGLGQYPDLWRFFEGSFEQMFDGCRYINKHYEKMFVNDAGEKVGVVAIFKRKNGEQ